MMKLSSEQIEAVARHANAQPIPDDNPAIGQLTEAFGDHTFYADGGGLLVLEEVPEGAEGAEAGSLVAIRLAEWADDENQSLKPVDPEMLGVIMDPSDLAAGDDTAE